MKTPDTVLNRTKRDPLKHPSRFRRELFLLATALMVACGDGESDGVHPPSDAGTNDRADSCVPDDQPTECSVTGALEFGRNGVVDPDVIDRKTNCLDQGTYHHTIWTKHSATDKLVARYCEQTPACNSCAALARVHEAMADPEVLTALDQVPPGVFGRDARGRPDAMYSVRKGAPCFKQFGMGPSGFDLGAACLPEMPDCYPIPPAIAHFVEQLRALEREQLSVGDCTIHG